MVTSQLEQLCTRLGSTAADIERSTTGVHDAARNIRNLAIEVRGLIGTADAATPGGQQIVAMLTAAAGECEATAAALLTAAAHGKRFVSRNSIGG